ncbi:MAG: hypothetical protein R3E79_08000 [Caldilineaceae bacterium]
MQRKDRIVRKLRIVMPIAALISIIVIAPLDLAPPLIAPLPDTVQEQVDRAWYGYRMASSSMSIKPEPRRRFLCGRLEK